MLFLLLRLDGLKAKSKCCPFILSFWLQRCFFYVQNKKIVCLMVGESKVSDPQAFSQWNESHVCLGTSRENWIFYFLFPKPHGSWWSDLGGIAARAGFQPQCFPSEMDHFPWRESSPRRKRCIRIWRSVMDQHCSWTVQFLGMCNCTPFWKCAQMGFCKNTNSFFLLLSHLSQGNKTDCHLHS